MFGPYYYLGSTASPSGSYAGGGSGTSWDFDAITTPAGDSTNSSYEWTHTPVGTPEYVVVAVAVNANSGADSVSGVTYGGSAMTRVPTDGFAQDTSGEPGSVYLYTLASPSAGAQTVAVAKTSATISTIAASYTLAGADGTPAIGDSFHRDEEHDSPYTTLDPAGDTGCAVAVAFSGAGTIGGAGSLYETGDTVEDNHAVDVSQSFAFGHAGPSTGLLTIGWTQLWNDQAFAAVLITDPGV